MSDSIKERITADLQKAKTTGGARVSRIREIIQIAASEALAEFKAGSGEIRTIAKDSLSTVVSSPTVQGEAVEAPTDSSTRFTTLLARAFQAIKTRVLGQVQQEKTDLQTRWITFDAKLAERYGDRYSAVKQRLNNAKVWYSTQVAKAEAQETTVLQQKQVEFESKAAAAGTSVGQREQQIRQQVKQFFQSATAKL